MIYIFLTICVVLFGLAIALEANIINSNEFF